eukprot:TRINITY_DN4276_c0_g2_i1.p1 TRINITY_DN4276_c0_g2~~TRINITY_DN4276_c0_g2_i1.p1  ORF type:complete len:200 (-),score=32.48 TRINITY_DN4276_c0_g2_i1:7-606(-)
MKVSVSHLAVACHTLGFFKELMKCIKQKLSLYLPDSELAMLDISLDSVGDSIQNHSMEILMKFITTMKARLESIFKNFGECFSEKGVFERSSNNDPRHYFKTLVKITFRLYNKTYQFLSEDEIQLIFRQIFSYYHGKLYEYVQAVEIKSESQKQKLVDGINVYIRKTSKILDTSELGEELVQYVESLPLNKTKKFSILS